MEHYNIDMTVSAESDKTKKEIKRGDTTMNRLFREQFHDTYGHPIQHGQLKTPITNHYQRN